MSKKNRISRTLVAASVVAALGCLSACAGDDGDNGDDGEDKKSSRSSAGEGPADASRSKEEAPPPSVSDAPDTPAARGKPLTEARLRKAALATGDVKGYQVEGTGSADLRGGSVPASPAACQPVADMFLFTTDPDASAAVSVGVTAKDDTDASVITVALLSYAPDEAEKVLAGLRRATGKCTEYTYVGYKYTGVEALSDPDKGDESLSFRMVASIEGAKVPAVYTVVRDGTNVVAFNSMNMLDTGQAEIPDELVEAQLAKLAKA